MQQVSSSSITQFCPNPDCGAQVVSGQSKCEACGTLLRFCSVCQHVTMLTSECIFCGTPPPTSTTQDFSSSSSSIIVSASVISTSKSERRPTAPLQIHSQQDIYTRFLANAYYEAALRQVNMRSVAEALETIRETLLKDDDPFKAWEAMNQQIGLSMSHEETRTSLRTILVDMREHFVHYLCEHKILALQELCSRDSEVGWRTWLVEYVSAFINSYTPLYQALSEVQLSFTHRSEQEVARVKRLMWFINQGRGLDGCALLLELAQQSFFSATERAILYAEAANAQYQDYIQPDMQYAEQLLQQATDIAPDTYQVQCAWASYWLKQKTFERVPQYLQQAIKQFPQEVEAYVLMGDFYKEQNDFEAAEEWYREAIKVKNSSPGGYLNLLLLFGIEQLFQQHEHQLLPLLEQLIALDPGNTYIYYVVMGLVYMEIKHFESAHSWFDKALQIKNTTLYAYLLQGSCYYSEQMIEQAYLSFQQMIDVAPEVPDGYLYLALIHDEQKEWQTALGLYERVLPMRPRWETLAHNAIGKIKIQLGAYEQAEQILISTLHKEPENETSQACLEELAEVYRSHERIADALRLYKLIRTIKGQTYEATYQNLVGNTYYAIEQYKEAQEAYSRAIASNSKSAVYYSNLSLAWEMQKDAGQLETQLSQAIDALQKALQLAHEGASQANKDYWEKQEALYRKRLENLVREQDVIKQYGETVVQMGKKTPYATITFAANLLSYLIDPQDSAKLDSRLLVRAQELRDRIRAHFGIAIPGITFDLDANAPDGMYIITFVENTAGGFIDPNKRFFSATQAELGELGITAEVGVNPQTGTEGYWIVKEHWPMLEAQGLPLWDILEYALRHVENLYHRFIAVFMNYQQLIALLKTYTSSSTEEIQQSMKKKIDLLLICQSLLREGVPIVKFDQICDAFVELIKTDVNLMAIGEHIRSLPAIRPTLPGNDEHFTFYQLGPHLTSLLEEVKRRHILTHQPVLTLSVTLDNRVLQAISDGLKTMPAALLVTQADLRPLVRKLVENFFPQLPVLFQQEVLPTFAEKMWETIDIETVP